MEDRLQDALSSQQTFETEQTRSQELREDMVKLQQANSQLSSKLAVTSEEFEAALAKREAEVKLLSQSLAEATDRCEQGEEQLQQVLSRLNLATKERDKSASMLAELGAAVQATMEDIPPRHPLSASTRSREHTLQSKHGVHRLAQHVYDQASALKSLMANLDATSNQLQQALHELQQRRDEKSQLSAELTAMQKLVDQKETTIDDLTKYYDRQEAASSELSQDVKTLQVDLSAARHKLETVDAVRESLQQALKISEEQLLQANSSRLELQLQVSTMTGELQRCSSELKQVKEENDEERKKQLDEVKQLRLEAQSQRKQLSHQVALGRKEEEKRQQQLDGLNAEKGAVQAQLDEALQKVSMLVKSQEQDKKQQALQREDLDLRAIDNSKHLADLTNQLCDVKDKLRQTSGMLKTTNSELARVKEDREAMRKQLNEARDLYDKAEISLHASQEGTRKLEAELLKKENEKQELVLAIEELMSREHALLAKLERAEAKQEALDLVHEEMVDYAAERRAKAVADDSASSASSLVTIATLESEPKSVRKVCGATEMQANS